MENKIGNYDEFADHPRYGRGPRVTGLNPIPTDANVHLHWNATSYSEIVSLYESSTGTRWPFDECAAHFPRLRRISNTAILADPSKQTSASIPVTHYYDLERLCRDCKRPFIFFAEEQKYWYEELGFRLEVDCIRCAQCRRMHRELRSQSKDTK